MKFNSCWSFLFGACVSSSTECSLCVPSGDLFSVDSPSENWYRHRLREIFVVICKIYYCLFMLLITKVQLSVAVWKMTWNWCHQCLTYSHILFSFPYLATVVHDRNQVYALLLYVTECVFLLEWTGILHLFIPISKNFHSCVWAKKLLPSSGVYRISLPPRTAAAAS